MTHYNKIIRMIETSDQIFRKVSLDLDLGISCVYEAFNQGQWQSRGCSESFGFETEFADEIFYEIVSLHDDANITILGSGCYRIVFYLDGNAVKVDLPHYRKHDLTANDKDWIIWNKFKSHSHKRFIIPIIDSFVIEGIGRINIFPLAETMERGEYNKLTQMNDDENENDLEYLQFKIISANLLDIHEGNLGYYKGNMVVIDFDSYSVNVDLDGRSAVFKKLVDVENKKVGV